MFWGMRIVSAGQNRPLVAGDFRQRLLYLPL